MSTRSNIILKNSEGKKEYLYKHHDGYLTGVGLTLFNLVKDLSSYQGINDVLMELPRKYEDTEGIHGDIEYCYMLEEYKCGNKKKVVISYKKRIRADTGVQNEHNEPVKAQKRTDQSIGEEMRETGERIELTNMELIKELYKESDNIENRLKSTELSPESDYYKQLESHVEYINKEISELGG